MIPMFMSRGISEWWVSRFSAKATRAKTVLLAGLFYLYALFTAFRLCIT
jgi:hypothetical protein